MKWAIRLIGATLSVLMLGTLVHGADYRGWQFDPNNYPTIKEWAGCKADLELVWDRSPVTSYYIGGDPGTLVVGAYEDPGIPYYAGLLIFLHEVGHCLQDQDGLLGGYITQEGRVAIELDADRYAADLACRFGLDGKGLLHDLFIWARDTFGYNGDSDHGTLAQRMAQGDNAMSCAIARPHVPSTQAP